MDDKKWKRKLPYRIYDYNYKVGESYYNPQTQYIEDRDLLRNKVVPPECASYAERFAAKPFYGGAYGLPYDEYRSALDQPLVRRRSVSGSRGDRGRDQEPASTSSAGRLGRSHAPRDRRLSFNLGDSDLDLPRRKFSLADDLDFKTPVSKYVDSDFGFRSSLDRDSLLGEKDSIGITPAMKESIQSDINKLEKQFQKASAVERGTGGPRAQQWREVVYEPETPTRKASVKRDNVSYRDPITGANVRKTSYQETSRLESSSTKPPRAPPKPSRLLSIEDSDFKIPSRPRRRHFSFSSGDDDDFDFKLSSGSVRGGDDNDVERKFSSSKKMFDSRRAQESEELTNNINKMLGKMRKHSLTGSDDSFSLSRSVRASSLDPEPRMRSSIRSGKYSSYGFSK